MFLDGKRDWVVSGGFSGSTVSGRQAAVLRLQLAAQRFYQRPDAPHVSVDPTATSLSGWGGRVGLNKNSGNVTFNAGAWGISPGFEPNDLGYATQTDRGGAHALVPFRKLTPDGFTRSRRLYVAKWWTFNYGAESQGDGVQLTAGAQFRNFWQVDMTLGKSWNTWDDKLTRGGPTTIRPGIESLNLVAASDARRRFWVYASAALSNREFGGRPRTVSATLNYRPITSLTLSVSPTLLKSHVPAQYLSTVPDATATATYGARYVFGGLDKTEASIPLRLTLVLSPRLSLQLYAQALGRRGAAAARGAAARGGHRRFRGPARRAPRRPVLRGPPRRGRSGIRVAGAARRVGRARAALHVRHDRRTRRAWSTTTAGRT